MVISLAHIKRALKGVEKACPGKLSLSLGRTEVGLLSC